MKVLVIGHSVVDYVHNNEKENVSPGGIFYSVSGLQSFLNADDELFLLSSIDKENEHLFSSLYNNINKTYVNYTDKIPRVHLRLFQNAERCEYYENITRNLSVTGIEKYNDFDGILINMITGFDITIKDLVDLRKSYKGLIYLDIHTLSRGLSENNERNFRLIPEVEKWISSVDILQVNENEIFTISPKKDIIEIARDSLKLGLSYFILTKGENGSRIFWLVNEELKSLFFPAIKTDVKNKIGCGDILGAVFFYSFIKNGNFASSLKLANIAAGCLTGYSDVKEIKKLKNDTFARLN